MRRRAVGLPASKHSGSPRNLSATRCSLRCTPQGRAGEVDSARNPAQPHGYSLRHEDEKSASAILMRNSANLLVVASASATPAETLRVPRTWKGVLFVGRAS